MLLIICNASETVVSESFYEYDAISGHPIFVLSSFPFEWCI
jgi:hypothetical protein